MEPDGRTSAAHLSRTRRSLPRPRLKLDNITGLTHTARGGPRRKPSADQPFLTEDGSTPQIKRRVARQRPPFIPLESTSVQLTKPATVPTGVTGHERVPLTTHNRAGATSKIPRPTPASTSSYNENTTQNLRKTGDSNHPTKPIGARLLRSASSILNVGLFNVATGNATQPSPYLSINTLDDLSRWDMDSLPSIPSPPDSPGQRTTSLTASPSVIRNPFSDPIEDDTLFENELPFPLSRHSKVILEDMGIKKTKNVTKGRSNLTSGGIILNRHTKIDSPTASPPPKGLPGLPHPLPTSTLCQNRASHRPLPSPPSQGSTKINPPPAEPKAPIGPSSSKKDAWGCTHLGASDCELTIAFPQTSHFEVWDMGDDSHIAIPALLCIMAKDARTWSGMPLALPDVSLLDIRCNDIPVRARMTAYDPNQEYYTHYMGPHPTPAGDKDGPDTLGDIHPPVMARDQITFQGHWTRTYSQPALEGGGRARVLRRGEIAHAYARAAGSMGFGAEARGWYLKFWIPIPTQLFAKRETRIFRIDARAWMMGDEDRVLSLDENKDGQVASLVADAQMTVSHLRAPREMDNVWWC